MDRRNFLIASGSSLLALSAGAATAAPSPDTTGSLTVMLPGNDVSIRLTEAAIVRFNARYPNVTVEPQYVSMTQWGEYITQLMNRVSEGAAPDVVGMATEGISTLGARGIVRDIMPFVEADPEGQAILDEIDPNLLSGLMYNDTLSYIPFEWNTVVHFYNTQMFEEAGLDAPADDWDWDDFLEVAKALTVRDDAGGISRFGYIIPGGQFALTPWFLNNGTDRLTADGRESNVSDPLFRETLEFLHSLIFEHEVAPTFVRNEAGHGPFIAEQVAIFGGTHGRVPEMVAAGFDHVAVTTYPRNADQVAIIGVGGYGITEGSPDPELAWELVKELSGADNSQQLADEMRALPPYRSAATTPEYVSFPANSEIFYGSASFGRALVQPPNFAQVESIMMRHIEAYLTGNRGIDDTISELDAELSDAMRRVRW